jgi:uncharacterized protein
MLRCANYNLTIAILFDRVPPGASRPPGTYDRTPSVKFQPDSLEGVNTISRHDGAQVWVGPQPYRGNLIVPWSGPVQAWQPTGFSALTQAHFDQLLQLEPELVIFGSGVRLRFPPPALLSGLIAARVGVESMDTAAACRTYNVLVSERRAVVAALLLEPTSAG